MAAFSFSKARESLSDAVELSQTEAVFLERHGRKAAVMVSPERYVQMMESLEKIEDVAAFYQAMAEEGPNIPWDEAKADLGLNRYRIELRAAALRSLRKLDPRIRRRVQGIISLLADDPRPPSAKKLKGRDAFRVRVGEYRVIYTVEEDALLVVVATRS